MLHLYVKNKEEWEKHLPLILHAYHTAIHLSTGSTPFDIMYGRPPQQASLEQMHFFDTDSHHHHLQAKLAEMRDFVETNLAESASRQRDHYNKHSQTRKFTVGDHVWLSIPTAKKLDPQWDGRWTITALKGPLNMEISDGTVSKVVHVNWLCHQIQLTSTDDTPQQAPYSSNWRLIILQNFTQILLYHDNTQIGSVVHRCTTQMLLHKLEDKLHLQWGICRTY